MVFGEVEKVHGLHFKEESMSLVPNILNFLINVRVALKAVLMQVAIMKAQVLPVKVFNHAAFPRSHLHTEEELLKIIHEKGLKSLGECLFFTSINEFIKDRGE